MITARGTLTTALAGLCAAVLASLLIAMPTAAASTGPQVRQELGQARASVAATVKVLPKLTDDDRQIVTDRISTARAAITKVSDALDRRPSAQQLKVLHRQAVSLRNQTRNMSTATAVIATSTAGMVDGRAESDKALRAWLTGSLSEQAFTQRTTAWAAAVAHSVADRRQALAALRRGAVPPKPTAPQAFSDARAGKVPTTPAGLTPIPGGCALPTATPSTWLGSAYYGGVHLWTTATQIAAHRAQLTTPSPDLAAAYKSAIKGADRDLDSAGTAATTGRHTSRVLGLGYAWLVTEDTRYAAGLIAETRRILGYDPSAQDRVDHAKLMTLAASALDWAGGTASDEDALRTVLAQRWLGESSCWIALEDNIVNKGLNKSLVVTSSAVVTSLGLASDQPEVAAAVVSATYGYLLPAMNLLKDGGTREGPTYWNFPSIPLAGVLSTWDAVHGQAPAKPVPSLRATGDFAFDATTADGVITLFADARDDRLRSTLPAWIAGRYGDPAAQAVARGGELRQGIELLWWNENAPVATARQDRAFPTTGLVALHDGSTTAWLKGQAPITIHSHLDAGTVGLVLDGAQWTLDLGYADGNPPGYFEIQPDGRRWTYANTQPRTHSTLRTTNGVGQRVGPLAPVSLSGGVARTDLSAVLGVPEASRTLQLDGRTAVIRDVVTGSRGLVWTWYTDAAVSVKGSVATLTKNGAKLTVTFDGLPKRSTLTTVKIAGHTAVEARIPAVRTLDLTVTATG